MKKFFLFLLLCALSVPCFAQEVSQGTYVGPDWLPNGAMKVGREDLVNGLLRIYGDNATQGARVIWENAADEDGTYEYWIIEANGADFLIQSSTPGSGGVTIDGDLDVTGSLTGASPTANFSSPPAIGDVTPNTGEFTAVGSITPGTGAFTTLTASTPIADASVADTLTIGASSTVADGALSANIGRLDAAATIVGNWVNTANPWADNEVADNLTISGGTVNNSVIGGSTPAAGSFTTLSASGNITAGTTAGGQRELILNADAASARLIRFQRSGLDGWVQTVLGTSGDLHFNRYNDAGAFVNAPLILSRATGDASFVADVSVGGNDVNLTGAATGRVSLASENTLTIQSQAGVTIGLDSDNDDADTRAFAIGKNASTTIFTVAESGTITATGSITFDAANAYNLADATNRLEDIFADDLRLGANDSVAGTQYIYGSSGYDGGELRIYNGADTADDVIDYWKLQAGDGSGEGDFVFSNPASTGAIVPGTDQAYDLGSSNSRWNDIYGDLINTNRLVVQGLIDFQSLGVTVGVGGDLTMTSPEPVVTSNSGTSDEVTSLNGSGGWFILRPASGHTITFVDDNSALDLAGNFVANHPNDTLFVMNIGAGQFIEVSRSNNQ